MEWFLNHPSMRYGGYVLFAIPIFMYVSYLSNLFYLNKNDILKLSLILIILTFFVFNFRNVVRLNKEFKVYKYDLISSPFFFVENVKSKKIFDSKDLNIYNPGQQMCWASKTPCSYKKKLKLKIFYG